MTLDIDALAQEIRRVDGKHDLGAGQLAEALMPFLSALREAAAPSEEPVAIAGNIELLQHQLDTFGPSPDGAVERDLAHAKELRILASPAVAPVAVSVKGLEWRDAPIPPSWECLASSAVGLYCIPLGRTLFALRFRDKDTLGEFDTLEAAKAAAQSDFNARILSSIIPATNGGETIDAWAHFHDGELLSVTLRKETADAYRRNGLDVRQLAALAQDTDGVAKP